MKKIKLNNGLQLTKEVVSRLQKDQLTNVKGGMAAGASCIYLTCNSKRKEK
ncbi:class I lanthipeptide [Psychroserpens luteolus]|uniref:class I lanthipeptide n=1 Tax=Psychroserpens luteolus TaxID=2855840 RepID=UPI001E411895|nr:class I lanthipeptide [Psychroserpens luteolus]MCD2258066.1 class I lanthipeptide [Psychroserpens luteolus]